MSPDNFLEQNHNNRTHHITKLPDELIASLPDYLHSLEDLYAVLQTCRLFYRCCAQTEAKLAPPFAKLYWTASPFTPSISFANRNSPPSRRLGNRKRSQSSALMGRDQRRRCCRAYESGCRGISPELDRCTRAASIQIRQHQPKFKNSRLRVRSRRTRTKWIFFKDLSGGGEDSLQLFHLLQVVLSEYSDDDYRDPSPHPDPKPIG